MSRTLGVTFNWRMKLPLRGKTNHRTFKGLLSLHAHKKDTLHENLAMFLLTFNSCRCIFFTFAQPAYGELWIQGFVNSSLPFFSFTSLSSRHMIYSCLFKSNHRLHILPEYE